MTVDDKSRHEDRAELLGMDYVEYTKWRETRAIEMLITTAFIVIPAVPVAIWTGSVELGAVFGIDVLILQQEILWRYYYVVPELAPSRRVLAYLRGGA